MTVNPHADLSKEELIHLLFNAQERIERLEAIANELVGAKVLDPTRLRAKGVQAEELKHPKGQAPWARVTTLEMDRRLAAKD